AIKENAIDYLLKPINPQDLKEAVNKAVHNYNLRIRNTEIQKLYENGKITKDVTQKIRQQINIREVYFMEKKLLK
ncbi:MAG: hypothetical protein ABRQ27_15410, partial [Clostridiaceae bacterium]